MQEAVALRMSTRKSEESLAAKTAEAAAEANKAAEASRLLESLRRDFNESSLKGAAPHSEHPLSRTQNTRYLALRTPHPRLPPGGRPGATSAVP